MKRKVGDKVRIKSRDEIEKVEYFYSGFVDEMYEYCGMNAIISHIYSDSPYALDIDARIWSWDDEMFED